MHLYTDDHIKDVGSTCRGSCNTMMEGRWLSTSSTSLSFWYSTSLSALCTQWGGGEQQGLLVLPFLHAVLLWSRQTRPKKTKATPFSGSRPLSCLEPAVWQHGSNQSVCLSILPSALCVCVFCLCWCVLVHSSPGQSLGIGMRGNGFHGALRMHHKHTVVQDGWHSKD